MSRKALLIVVVLLVLAGGYWYFSREKNVAPTVIIGSKDFTESILLGEIFAQALETEGIRVDRKQALGGTAIIQAAMEAGEVNFYPEYTSTSLMTVLKQEAEFDPRTAYEKVRDDYRERFDFAVLEMSPLNNSQGMAITQEAAEAHNVRTLTDLSREAPNLRLCSTAEFEEREDGLAGLRERLGGFEFASMKVFDKGIKYEVLRNGEADVNVCFTTDAQLADGKIRVIEDDIAFWPPYNLIVVVRADTLNQLPQIADIVNPICAALDNATMQALNAQVDLEQKEYREVAAAFLKEKGFVH